jgi:hypothetical protein
MFDKKIKLNSFWKFMPQSSDLSYYIICTGEGWLFGKKRIADMPLHVSLNASSEHKLELSQDKYSMKKKIACATPTRSSPNVYHQ